MSEELFLGCNIKQEWLKRASDLGKAALEMALGLCFWQGVKQTEQLKLSRRDIREFLGTPERSGIRGIESLEKAGLVEITDNGPGRKQSFRLVGAVYTTKKRKRYGKRTTRRRAASTHPAAGN